MSPMNYADDPRWGIYLEQVIRVPDRTTALATAQITLSEFYERVATDPEFAAECANAHNLGFDSLEDIAVKRAVFGIEKPVWWQGQVVGYETQYSERLLIFLLSGNRSKYRGEGEKNTSLSEEARRELDSVFRAAASGADVDEDAPASPLDPGNPPKKPPTKLPRKTLQKLEKDYVAKLGVTPASVVEVPAAPAAPSLVSGEDEPEIDGVASIDIMKTASEAEKSRRGSARLPASARKTVQETAPEPPKGRRRK